MCYGPYLFTTMGMLTQFFPKSEITIFDADMLVLKDPIEAALAKTGKKPPVRM